MATPYFEEVQRLRDNPWIFVVIIVAALGALLPLFFGIHQQLVLGIPWGEKPMSNEGLLLLTMFIFAVVILLAFMLTSLKLETRIDEYGVHYRLYPVKPKWKTILPSQIASYRLDKKFKIFETGGVGYHKNLLKGTTSFKIRGGQHLTLELSDGHRLMLGTQNFEGIEMAMRKLMDKSTAY